jgi:hypothetical protein
MRAVPDGWRHASSELNAVLFAGRMSDSVQQSAYRLCRALCDCGTYRPLS